MTEFKHAIVRPPATNFAAGLTSADLGVPDIQLARDQHAAYCRVLEECGLTLTVLRADDEYPDSTFVEDTAILTTYGAVICRPGAESRAGEVHEIAEIFKSRFSHVTRIREPGTVDGGDVCEVEDHFFIGISQRTNIEGASQLAEQLRSFGLTAHLVDIRGMGKLLHLKSGVAHLGQGRLVLIRDLADRPEFDSYERVVVAAGEEYAANCIELNGRILIASGFPQLEAQIRALGHRTIGLEMSEFRKMDGGLSCLSLRF